MDGELSRTVSEQETMINGISRLTPNLQYEPGGIRSHCIFKISDRIRGNNNKAYDPEFVSIGPYHHGKEQLRTIEEEHKPRFLRMFAEEARKNGVARKELMFAVSDCVEALRDSYAEKLVGVDRDQLLNMMLMDGCFILTLFLSVSMGLELDTKDDPIFQTPSILNCIRSDLLLVENQVPFCLLETLLETSRISVTSDSLKKMAFKFFSDSRLLPKSSRLSNFSTDEQPKHLLDLMRQTLIPDKETSPNQNHTSRSISGSRPYSRPCIVSATRLCNNGLVLKPREKADTLLDIQLKEGVLEIPPLILDDLSSQVFLNFVAFERHYGYCSKHIMSYVVLMSGLINNKADVRFLSKQGILENCNEIDYKEVSRFFKTVGNDVRLDISASYLAPVFEGLNKHTSKEVSKLQKVLCFKL
ncbi:PREDICTED: UPF0481 protein At3g47200-like [Camelina sativa]|uniref:UPF0481 protein At3g47200-like n=1 Tax=Camelina sativa TaxID=90675 RepID=A0ABM0XR76_CAMSA|nr:PREDICTED: UPF0481 protein At3g47200-like [Camelina sativa]